ncbi:MAG: homoserine dehydrogenase [Desulfovibrio sp.]|nr:homoserine dehydrogenase [Desulfovibrio sp.]
MTQQSQNLVIGLAGLGTVGGGLVSLLASNADIIERRTGKRIVLKRVLVHNLAKPRTVPLPPDVSLTDDLTALTDDPEIDAIVEVIGGKTTAKDLISRALDHNKHIVTANKALLAEEGQPLFSKAKQRNRILRYEASVAGAIPIVQALKESLASNHIHSLVGILNGTSNYVLSEMTNRHLDFTEALNGAQKKGYAEADPSLDIDGHDAAHKLVLLIRLAFGVHYDFTALPIHGIRGLSKLDIELADQLGYHIKLVGQVREAGTNSTPGGPIEAGVFPALVPHSFLLARVEGAFNAIHIKADAAGSLFFHGRGAGDLPTASAVLADLLAVAREEYPNNTGFALDLPDATVADPNDWTSCYYVRMMVEDTPGVLRDIAGCMARFGVSMSHVIQRTTEDLDLVPLVLLTHETTEKAMQSALRDIETLLKPKELVSFKVLS